MSVKYQAGSFEYKDGFARSILCTKITSGEQFLLVNTGKTYNSPDDAAILAKTDIEQSLSFAQTKKFESIDHALSASGYQKYEDE